MRWNLVGIYGQGTADRFRELYEGVAARQCLDQAVWDLVTLLDLVLDVRDPILRRSWRPSKHPPLLR